MLFPAGVNVTNFSISIIDDEVAECSEWFFLDLEIQPAASSMGVCKGSPDSVTVTISDDDSCECCFNALVYNSADNTVYM